MQYCGAGGKLIQEKNQKQKISWHCPFKPHLKIIFKLWIWKSFRIYIQIQKQLEQIIEAFL